MSGPLILDRQQIEKVWGRETLPPPFEVEAGERIGEIVFAPPACFDELLAKYLFTSDKLSVQVHPTDSDAPTGHRGKDECWVILRAEVGAKLALGFQDIVSPEKMRAAALDGSIEAMLAWHEVRAGDVFYVPAGTVHAIGPGLSLIEIQQNSDVTYRLYDYGRPRELHLDRAVAVARGETYDSALRKRIPERGGAKLVEGPKFSLDLIDGAIWSEAKGRYAGSALVMPLEGRITSEGEELAVGTCAIIDAAVPIEFEENARLLLAQPVRRD